MYKSQKEILKFRGLFCFKSCIFSQFETQKIAEQQKARKRTKNTKTSNIYSSEQKKLIYITSASLH